MGVQDGKPTADDWMRAGEPVFFELSEAETSEELTTLIDSVGTRESGTVGLGAALVYCVGFWHFTSGVDSELARAYEALLKSA
jgi:hypothetical protein